MGCIFIFRWEEVFVFWEIIVFVCFFFFEINEGFSKYCLLLVGEDDGGVSIFIEILRGIFLLVV